MPTGYTSEIYDGKDVSGNDFLMQCARAFGACIMMRDESLDSKLPEEFQPSAYHKERIKEAKTELKKYQNMTIEEAILEIEKNYQNTIRSSKESRKKYSDMKNRYLNTLADVLTWQPPTDEHKELKKFAIQQLQDSINYDCNHIEDHYPINIQKETPQKYIEKNINGCLKDIEYNSKEWNVELEGVARRNKWIKELRGSL